MKKLLAILIAGVLAGCATIKGTVNTSVNVAPIPKGTSITVSHNKDGPIADKIGLMLAYKLAHAGFKLTRDNPQLVAEFSFDVVPDGETSQVFTSYDRRLKTSYSTVVSSRDYKKTIGVRIRRLDDNNILWSGTVDEVGWCNQVFVTAPNILALMFRDFPAELTNVSNVVSSNDQEVKAIRALFSENTNWGC